MEKLRQELGLHGPRRSPAVKKRANTKALPEKAKASAIANASPKPEMTSTSGKTQPTKQKIASPSYTQDANKAQPSVSPRSQALSTKRLLTFPSVPTTRSAASSSPRLNTPARDDNKSRCNPAGTELAKELCDDGDSAYETESSSSEHSEGSSIASPIRKKMVGTGVVGNAKLARSSNPSSSFPSKHDRTAKPDGRTAAALTKRAAVDADAVHGLAKKQKQTGSEKFAETGDGEEAELEIEDEVFTRFRESTPNVKAPALFQDDTMVLSGRNPQSAGRRFASTEYSYNNNLDPSLMDGDSEEEKMALAEAAARAYTKTPFRALTDRELDIISFLTATELAARVSRGCPAPNELEHSMRARFLRVFPLPSYDLACHSTGLPTRVWGDAENVWLIRMVDATRRAPRNQTPSKRPFIPWRYICEMYWDEFPAVASQYSVSKEALQWRYRTLAMALKEDRLDVKTGTLTSRRAGLGSPRV
jgi:hypothetical protein